MLTNRLDTYMAELEQKLNRLPEAQRQEELTEIRGHLEEISAAYREMGLSEEQAFADAEQQFGDTVQLSRAIKKVYRNRFMYVAGETAAAFVVLYLMCRISNLFLRQAAPVTEQWSLYAVLSLLGASALVTGIALGRVTRRAYSAIGGLLAFLMLSLAIGLHQHPDIAVRLFYANFPYHIAYAVCQTSGAWIGNRWRQKRQKSQQVFA